ncbi:hypothetical protein PHET_03370 [Paragonimus heterotremus]|uniref:Uncharacterized protein n=1 Tax=Paragonimus heterotremus TaxID=100268 RepID=A0A8J4TJL8_9TREM|nr:hypothetical protein PHET_03370 [Paragonimus heterotremus]
MHRTNTVCACGRPQAFSHVLSEISPAEISVFCSTATASVTSVTTDDTGIESSSLGASPTLPCCPKSLQHAEIKATPWGKEQPPPIPPKAGRHFPPIPPKPFVETFEVVKSNLHKISGSTCLPSTGCFSTSSLPSENVNVKVSKSREPEVTHNVHSSSTVSRLHSGGHLSPSKHEVKTGRLIALPNTSPNRNRVLISQSECSNCSPLKYSKASCSKRTSYSSLGPSFISRKNCPPTSCSYSPDRNAGPSVSSIEATQPCFCQVNRHWNVKSLPPTPNQMQPTFRRIPPSDLNCDLWSTPRLFNLAARPNYTDKSASKPGCGSLQWISHTLTRVFCTGLGRGRSTDTKTEIMSGINNEDRAVCKNNLSEPLEVPLVSASASNTNSLISSRGQSKSSVACGVSLWHNRSRSCYCSHNTVPSGTLPSDLSSASYHSSPARRTNRMNSPTKSHVIPPPTPASLDPELFSGISHSVLIDSKDDKKKLCGMNLSGRSHPLPPSRTADVSQKRSLSRWALHAPSLSMEVPRSDCSCICLVQPTSAVPTVSYLDFSFWPFALAVTNV